MSRIAGLIWSKAKRRWYANVGTKGPDGKAREVFAPSALTLEDRDAAAAWLDRERGRRQELKRARVRRQLARLKLAR